MFCTNCGKEIPENAEFCGYCGFRMNSKEESSNFKESNNSGNSYSYEERKENIASMATNVSAKDIEGVLVDPTENVIATFGNSYFKSLVVSGNLKKYAYILTDKRLYYKGVGYYNVADAKMVTKVGEEFIVDLQNISCSGFVYTVSRHTFLYALFGTIGALSLILLPVFTNSYFYEFCYFLCVIAGISVVAIIILYILEKIHQGVYFLVNFNGGKIEVKIDGYSFESASDFNKQIRKAKGSIE